MALLLLRRRVYPIKMRETSCRARGAITLFSGHATLINIAKRLFLAGSVFLPSLAQAQSWPPDMILASAAALPRTSPAYQEQSSGIKAGQNSLADYLANTKPWLAIAANSEQRQPVYFGRRPREIELGLGGSANGIPPSLKNEGERQINEIRRAMLKKKLISPREAVEIEGWPVRDDHGMLTWAFATWKRGSSGARAWLDVKLPGSEKLAPFLPEFLHPSSRRDRSKLFADVLEYKDLYQKPLFGDAIWVDQKGRVQSLWLPPDSRADFAAGEAASRLTAVVLPQPARFDGAPVSDKILSQGGSVQWPASLKWGAPPAAPASAGLSDVKISAWPADFTESYRKDVMLLAGEINAVFPMSKRQARFVKKNNIEPSNQLDAMISYLQERYALLGIASHRQDFTWRGEKQTNLVAVIPGADHSRPILMADHIDTAFCEDVFGSGGRRVSAPGADDNMSAAATLLRAAEIFKGRKLARDIWLVHLTGEEFPADDLGARYFISSLLSSKTDIGGLVLMDMIGWRQGKDPVFQISAGESAESLGMAQVAVKAAQDFQGLSPALRTRFDPKSYLYNTDGLIFSDAGFPVILFNEHLNSAENISRPGYHDTTDTSARIDWEYATGIAKIAITTAARLAGMQ